MTFESKFDKEDGTMGVAHGKNDPDEGQPVQRSWGRNTGLSEASAMTSRGRK